MASLVAAAAAAAAAPYHLQMPGPREYLDTEDKIVKLMEQGT